MALDPLYLLDTGIFIHAVRASNNSDSINRTVWERIKAACNPLMADPPPVYSIVSKGELLSFGKQHSWGDLKNKAAAFYLNYFKSVSIDDEQIIQAYAEIDTYSKLQAGREMGKNDLWIAATAQVLKATLVTIDRDFDHLHGIYFDRVFIEGDS